MNDYDIKMTFSKISNNADSFRPKYFNIKNPEPFLTLFAIECFHTVSHFNRSATCRVNAGIPRNGNNLSLWAHSSATEELSY